MSFGFTFIQSGLNKFCFGTNSTNKTCSIIKELSQRCLASFHLSPSLLYRWQFSQSSCFSSWCLVLLLRQTTGHIEQPNVQQQQRHPHSSQRTLTGSVLRRVTFTRVTVALNSSGATLEWRRLGNSVSNLFESPKTVMFPAPLITTGSGVREMFGASRIDEFSSWSS